MKEFLKEYTENNQTFDSNIYININFGLSNGFIASF